MSSTGLPTPPPGSGPGPQPGSPIPPPGSAPGPQPGSPIPPPGSAPGPAPQPQVPWYRKPEITVPSVLAIIAIIVSTMANLPANRSADADTNGDKRAKQEEDEKKALAVGPPVSISGGSSDFLPLYYAFPGRTTSLGPAAGYSIGSKEYAEWLKANNAQVVGADSARFTVRALHEGTVIIQGMRLSDVKCTDPINGTLVLPAPVGGPGDEVEKTTLAFDLSERNPKPRELQSVGGDGDEFSLGNPYFSKSIYLEGGKAGDARTFEVYFLAGTQDCEFGIEVNVTSNDKESWIPAELAPGETRAKISAFAKSYQSIVAPTGPGEGSIGQKLVPVNTPIPGFKISSPGRR